MPSTRTEKRQRIVARRVLPADRRRGVGRLALDGRQLRMVLGERLTAAQLERTIDGASTVTLDVWDGDRSVLRSGAFGERAMSRNARLHLDGISYNVAGVGRNGNTLTLTCEEQLVVNLKRHGKTKPVRQSRGKTTRAAFCARLIRQAGIPVIVLDETRVQPIAGSKPLGREVEKARRASSADRGGRSAARGLANANVTVKGRRADSQQRRTMQAVLDAAIKVPGASGKPLVALIAAIIIECEFRNVQGGGADAISFGVIQAIPGTTAGPNGTFTRAQALNIEYSVRAALLPPGPTSNGGGLIQASRRFPNENIGQLADRVINGLGVGDPAYVPKVNGRKVEAEAIIAAYGGDGPATDSSSTSYTRGYAFERKRGESTWTACRRLLDEVRWRLFVREGVVIIASDPALMRAKASLVFGEATDHWSPDFEWHRALRVSEMSGRVAADRYQADPGEVIQVRDLPPLEDRWLLATSTVDLLSETAPVEVKLRRPQDPKKEPKAETRPQGGGSGGATAGTGSLRERIVEIAESTLTDKTGHRYYSQEGALTADPLAKPPLRSDCSQWVRAIYLKAGAGDPGTWTGDQYARSRRTSRPKPGDLVLYPAGSGSRHVELYVGGGRTIGHGDPQIDYSTPGAGEYRTYDFLDRD